MMQCLIYSQGKLIAHADFVGFDPGMGCTLASFIPGENYEEIRPTVRAFTSLGSFADVDATRETRAYATEVYQRCAALDLTAYTHAGELLEPAGGIALFDFSEELDNDPYEVHLLGLPRDISEKYLHEAIQQYYGETRQEDEQP